MTRKQLTGCHSQKPRRNSALEDLLGFVIINKPTGLTSHGCVNRIRRFAGIKRVGHGGTLDPAVTGVLPIAIGKATRLFTYLPGDKTYLGKIQLGVRTTTDDLQGEILETQSWPQMDKAYLKSQLNCFKGEIEQIPPNFSSVHIQGKRAYQIARRGESVLLAPRRVTIHSLNLLNWDQTKGQLEISVHCSSGTYIRSLARDLGVKLGCNGCLAKLQRTQALGFHDWQSIPLPDETKRISKDFFNLIVPPLKALTHMKKLRLSAKEVLLWRTGRTITPNPKQIEEANKKASITTELTRKSIVVVSENEEFEGIGDYLDDLTIKPKVVFNAI